MNQTYIHLLITHLPIFGSIFGGLVLAQGLRTRCDQTKIAAYYIFIISAMGAGIAYLTGEAAEKTVENIQGVAEPMVEVHENFAVFAFVSFIILGISSIGGLILTLRKSTLTSTAAIVTMFITLISFGLVARTAYLGGQIRHTEIHSQTTNIEEPQGKVEIGN